MNSLVFLGLIGACVASPYYRNHYHTYYQPRQTHYRSHQTYYQPHQTYNQHYRSQVSYPAAVPAVPTLRIVEAPVSSAGAAAALAYASALGAEDLCGRATKAYLETVMAGGDSVAATQAATDQYMADYAAGVASGPACVASARAWQDAAAAGQDPLLSAAQTFMANYRTTSNDLCAASGAEYIKAVLAGADQNSANLIASKAFFTAYSAGSGLESDSACAAAAKAYSAASVGTPSAPTANAMTAFIAYAGAGRSFDPACASAASAYIASYEAGEQELNSNLAGALAFINSYKSGAAIPTNSACLAAAKAYSAALPSTPSAVQNAAMLTFIEEAVQGGFQDTDSVCLSAAEAYIQSYMAGVGEARANEAAGIAFLDAVAATPRYNPGSACGRAAKAYIAGF